MEGNEAAGATPLEMSRSGISELVLPVSLLAVVYVATALVGLAVPVAFGNATPVWAPAGIALAALLLWGPRVWPGVALGALIANAATDISLWVALAIAVGNTLEALTGATLLRRARFQPTLRRVRDVIALTALGALISTAVSATVGVTSLWIGGEIDGEIYASSWEIWWFGDAMGILLVAPFILVWATHPRPQASAKTYLEAGILTVLLGVVSTVVFFWAHWRFAYAVLLPLLIWAALRFRQRGVTAGSLIIAGIAVAATLSGSVPVTSATARENVAILQAQMSIIAVALLIVVATSSERDRAEKALRDSEERFRRVFEDGPLGMVIVDRDLRFMRANKAVTMILGYPEDELIGLTLRDVTHPDDVELDLALATEALRGDLPTFNIEKRYIRKDGSEVPAHLTATIIHDVDGEPLYGLGIIEDITDRRRAEEAARAALERERLAAERLRELDRLKNEFVAMVAHDLRSPLGAIGNVAFLLRDKWELLEPAQRNDLLERISHRTTELAVLVHNILDVAAIEAGELSYDIQRFDIGALATRTVEEIATAHPERRLLVELEPGLPAALGDEHRHWQILVNLLGNAIKFSDESEPIEIAVSSDDGAILVAVRDRGMGIPPNEQPKLFRRFSPLDHHRRGTGTGLGLYMCRSMVEAQGGRIWAESEPGRGSIFSYTIPIAP